jgi:hypothetical protein
VSLTPSQPRTEQRSLVEAVIASTIGTTIEWYDFFLYGIAATEVFPKLFFPEWNDFSRLIASVLSPDQSAAWFLATWAIAWVASPHS